jgi:uncharacterized protein with ParB-like and HNH nuclease domain
MVEHEDLNEPEEDEPEEDEPVDDEAEPEHESFPITYEITAYGADYPVDGLVSRVESGDVEIPEFQRQFIWTKRQSDRFIESLLLGLPVPGIFLSRSPSSTKLLVIDGQQRLRTLHGFYKGILRGREFTLEHVADRFKGKTYEKLEEDDKRRLNDSILHATVVRQDQPSDDQSSIYSIFERLNTGGTDLSPQEIRAALYQGAFNDLLFELNETPAWRDVFGRVSSRMKDQELILRFFALRHERGDYARPMEKFLSDFMARNRELEKYDAETLRREFITTIEVIDGALGNRAFRLAQAVNAAVFDSVMVGLSERLDKGEVKETGAVKEAYEALIANEDYLQASTRATADEARVEQRVGLAVDAFAPVK